MNPSVPKSEDPKSELDAPPRPELRWIRWCLIPLLFAFALDFRPDGTGFAMEDARSFGLLGIALASGGAALLIGLRHLLVRPGAFLILLWFGSLALSGVIGFLQNGEPVEILRSLGLPLLFGLGITTTHVAACSGMRAREAIRFFLIAAGVGLLWRFGLGFVADPQDGFAARLELLSPTLGLLTAWAACALLLKRSFSRWDLVCFGLALIAGSFGIVRGVSMSIFFPVAGASICLLLGTRWRFFPREHLWRKLAPAGVLVALGVFQLVSGGIGTESQPPAEGIPGSLQSATAFLPPNLGPSTGLIGAAAMLSLILMTMALSLRSAWRNSETVMGRWARDAHLMFLPFVALFCLLGESLLLNPPHQPLAAVLIGFLVAMPQFFFNRVHYLQHRENEAAITPQLILNEEDLPTPWEGTFPSSP